MEQSIRERIARLLCAFDGRMAPDTIYRISEHIADAHWRRFEPRADAILAAMEEPTPLILEAMADNNGNWDDLWRAAIHAAREGK